MTLIPCPRCGNPVSDKARQCPKCGMPLNHQTDNFNPDPDNDPDKNNRGPWIWVVILLIVIMLIAIVAIFIYHNKQVSEREQLRIESELHRRDSIAAEQARQEAEAREAAEQARRDSIEWVNFTTPDLKLLDLHGHVKSVTLSGDAYYLGYIYTFKDKFNINESGLITNLATSRNGQNQITKIREGFDHEMSIEWSDKYPVHYQGYWSDSGEDATLSYSDGRLISISQNSGSEGCNNTSINTLTPIEHDKYGNWIVASVKVKGEMECDNGYYGGVDVTPISETKRIRRTINYYPR